MLAGAGEQQRETPEQSRNRSHGQMVEVRES
jgi:hypothetical protein